MLARRLMCGSRKLRVAASTTSAVANHDAIIDAGEVMDDLSRVFVVDDRADRNLQDNVSAIASCLLCAFAMPSALGFVFRIKTKMHERIVAFARFHPDVAAFAAVAARRTAARNKLL